MSRFHCRSFKGVQDSVTGRTPKRSKPPGKVRVEKSDTDEGAEPKPVVASDAKEKRKRNVTNYNQLESVSEQEAVLASIKADAHATKARKARRHPENNHISIT